MERQTEALLQPRAKRFAPSNHTFHHRANRRAPQHTHTLVLVEVFVHRLQKSYFLWRPEPTDATYLGDLFFVWYWEGVQGVE